MGETKYAAVSYAELDTVSERRVAGGREVDNEKSGQQKTLELFVIY